MSDLKNRGIAGHKRKKLKIDWVCVNSNCIKSKSDEVVTAKPFVIAYYGAKIDEKRKRKVCMSCYVDAKVSLNKITRKIESKESFYGKWTFKYAEFIQFVDLNSAQFLACTRSEVFFISYICYFDVLLFHSKTKVDRTSNEACQKKTILYSQSQVHVFIYYLSLDIRLDQLEHTLLRFPIMYFRSCNYIHVCVANWYDFVKWFSISSYFYDLHISNDEKIDVIICFSFYRGTSSHHQRNCSCFGRFGRRGRCQNRFLNRIRNGIWTRR